MKIRYINEAFKKIGDLKKNEKSISTETFRNKELINILAPIINRMNGSSIVPFRCYNNTIGTLFYFPQIEETKDVNFIFEGITEDDVLNLSLNILINDGLLWTDCNICVYDEIALDESKIRKRFDETFTNEIFRYFKRFATGIDITKAIKKVHFTKAVLLRKYPNSDKLTNINIKFISQENENDFFPIGNIPISIVKKNVDLFNDLIVTNGRKLVRYDDPKFSVDAKEMPVNSELCRSVKTALDYHKNIKGNLTDDINSKYFGMNTTSAYKLEIQTGYIDLNKYVHSGKIVKEYIHLYPYENENEYTLYLAVNGYIKKIDEFLHDASRFVNLKGLTQVYGKSSASFAMYKNGIEQRWKDLPYFSIIEKRIYRNSPAWFLFTFENGKYKGVSRLPIFEGVSSDSIQESFKKISNLKKNADTLSNTKIFRNSYIKSLIEPILNKEKLILTCIDSFKIYVCPDTLLSLFSPFTKKLCEDLNERMQIKYNGLEDNILHISIEIQNIYAVNILDSVFKNKTSYDIRKEIGDCCISEIYKIWKDEIKDIDAENIFSSLYVDNIILYPKQGNVHNIDNTDLENHIIPLSFQSINEKTSSYPYFEQKPTFMSLLNKAINNFIKISDLFISPASLVYSLLDIKAIQSKDIDLAAYKNISNIINHGTHDDSSLVKLNLRYIAKNNVHIYGREEFIRFLDINKYSLSNNIDDSIICTSKSSYRNTNNYIIGISSNSIESLPNRKISVIFDKSAAIEQYGGNSECGRRYIKTLANALMTSDIEYYAVIAEKRDNKKNKTILTFYTFNYGEYLGKCFLQINNI